jgi:hypothetical protein
MQPRARSGAADAAPFTNLVSISPRNALDSRSNSAWRKLIRSPCSSPRTDSAGVILITLLPANAPPLFSSDSETSSTSFSALPSLPATTRSRCTK